MVYLVGRDGFSRSASHCLKPVLERTQSKLGSSQLFKMSGRREKACGISAAEQGDALSGVLLSHPGLRHRELLVVLHGGGRSSVNGGALVERDAGTEWLAAELIGLLDGTSGLPGAQQRLRFLAVHLRKPGPGSGVLVVRLERAIQIRPGLVQLPGSRILRFC